MRATRDGGSPSSARALGAIKSKRPAKHTSRDVLLFPPKVAFMFVPLSSTTSPDAWPIGSTSVVTFEVPVILPCGRTRRQQLSCFGCSHILILGLYPFALPCGTGTIANCPKIRTLGQARFSGRASILASLGLL